MISASFGWTCSTLSMPLLYCGALKWMWYPRYCAKILLPKEHHGKGDNYFPWPTGSAPVKTAHDAVDLLCCHYMLWLIFSQLSTMSPRSFAAELLSTASHSQSKGFSHFSCTETYLETDLHAACPLFQARTNDTSEKQKYTFRSPTGVWPSSKLSQIKALNNKTEA